MPADLAAWHERRFGRHYRRHPIWFRDDGVAPHIAYPAPQHMSPSRRSDAIYVGVDGRPLRPFTALTLPGHDAGVP